MSHDRCDAWRISLPGYLLRALVGRDVRAEVGLYPARRVLRDPPSALFVLAAPEGVYLSAIGMPMSLPLLCARRAPAKMLRNAEISKNLRVSPLRANRCREMPRGRRVIVCGAWFRFGTDYLQNVLYKTLDPTPFLASSAVSERLGFGMRLARISRTPPLGTHTRLCPTFTGVARTGGESCRR